MTELRARYITLSSAPELALENQLTLAGITGWQREHRFHEIRRWRFDFAFPAAMLAVEIDGGAWIQGRHTRGAGFAQDCEKFNEATLMGWRVLRFTPQQVTDGTALRYIEAALGMKK